MQLYAKYIDLNEVLLAPNYYEGWSNFDSNIELMLEKGFLPLEETNTPASLIVVKNKYELLADKILLTFVEGANTSQKMKYIDELVQTRLDNFAAERDFGNIMSAATYINSKIAKFAKDAQICLDVRDATWFALYNIRDKFLKGEIAEPSIEEILAQLPSLDWNYYDNLEANNEAV